MCANDYATVATTATETAEMQVTHEIATAAAAAEVNDDAEVGSGNQQQQQWSVTNVMTIDDVKFKKILATFSTRLQLKASKIFETYCISR